jgi:hypothetical protein
VRGHRSRSHPPTAPYAAFLASILTCLVSVWPVRADEDLQSCLGRSVAQAKANGAVVERAPHTDFLLTGDARVYMQRFDRASCLSFFAAGAKFTQAVDLTVLAPSGKVLAQGESRVTLPRATYCGHANESVFVSVRVTDGQGEVVYGALSGPGSELEDAVSCGAVGAPRPLALELGPEPSARSLEDELQALSGEFRDLGYAPDGLVAFGALLSGQHEARMLNLEADRCYALAAVGDADVVDLDLRVFAQGTAPEPIAADTTRRRNAVVKLCTTGRTRYVLDTAIFQGDGAYVVEALRLTEPARVPGIEGQARISYAELGTRMQARGFAAEPITTGLVAANERLRVPLPVRGGVCYAFAAVAVSDSPRGALDLGVLDERGRLVALDSGKEDDPLVYHCPAADGVVSVLVRAKNTRGTSRFALVVGHEPASGEKGPT